MFDSLFPKEWTTLQRLMWLKTNALARTVYEIVTGNPVTFTAKKAPLRQLEVAFSPVQSLNGYDSPWPAGGGKNKFCFPEYSGNNYIPATSGLTSISVDEDEQTLTLGTLGQGQTLVFVARPFQAGQCAISFDVSKYNKRSAIRCFDANDNILTGADISVTGATWNSFYKGFYLSQGVVTVPNEVDHFWVGIGVADDQSGDTVVISNVQLEFGSSVTSYAPYSNICPISGWDSLTVEQRGVNLWNKANAEDGYVDDADGEIKASDPYKHTGFIPVKPNTQYYVKTDQTSAAWGAWYDADKRYISGVAQYQLAPTITAPANAAYVNLTVKSSATGDVNTFGLNYPATVTDFVPYNGRSISISLGETVYSGTVDVVTGVGEVTWGITDAADLPWSYDGARWQSKMSGIEVFPTRSANILFEKYGTSTSASAQTENMGFTVGGAVYIYTTDSVNSPTGKICYPLATPIPIQLTPQEVQSLAGDNTMWTDGDSLTVEYRSN